MEIGEVIKMMENILGLPQDTKDNFIRECLDKMKKASSKQGFPKSAMHIYQKEAKSSSESFVIQP